MNSIPNFDMKNPREYPIYDHASMSKDHLSTGRRILRSFNSKVVFWAVLTILVLWAFFEKPFVSPVGGNLLGDWLFFAGGLILGIGEGIIQQKRAAANQLNPVWLRVLLIIAILVASFLVVHFLATNNFFFSLCEGGIAGSSILYAIAAYRSNRAAISS